MKFVRHCLIASTVCALSACTSSSPVRSPLFTKRPIRQESAAPAPATATTTPSASPAPVVEPVVSTAPEPVAPVAPEVPVAPVAAAPISVNAESAPAPIPVPAAVTAPGLKATRTGQLVQLTWMLPVNESGYRAIEVMRNTSELAKGRTRVKTLRSTVTQWDDTVENTGDRYWYWLKLTDQTNTVINLGPVEAVETAR